MKAAGFGQMANLQLEVFDLRERLIARLAIFEGALVQKRR
jgi:hypothetical protein